MLIHIHIAHKRARGEHTCARSRAGDKRERFLRSRGHLKNKKESGVNISMIRILVNVKKIVITIVKIYIYILLMS